MKKTNKTTSKKITQLKGELGEMLKQFEKIKIEKQVKANKTAISTQKTNVKKNSSFLKDDFLSDNFFKKNNNKLTKKKTKSTSKNKETPIQEESKEAESDNPFIDITLDQEESITENNIKTIIPDTTIDDSIYDLEIEITELTSELTALENDLSTPKIQSDNTIIESQTGTNITPEKELSESQKGSYLTIKQKLNKIKSEISNSNIVDKIEYTENVNTENTPLSSRKKTQQKKEIQKSKKELPKKKENKIISNNDNNNVDKLTIVILGLVVIILVIVWFIMRWRP